MLISRVQFSGIKMTKRFLLVIFKLIKNIHILTISSNSFRIIVIVQFEKYVTDDYLQAFEKECKKLNANFNVEIVSRESSGQTLKKLQIRGTAPGKVLSEGEQRAISIANFLTEVQMDSRNIGIVLDAPVCSLDHKRRSLIVKRLLEEATFRQVVVFVL